MHHYLGCGLPNVWLENGFHVRQTEHGEAIAIEDARDLHKVIGVLVAHKSSPLSGAEFRFLRKELGLSQESLAEIVGKSSQAVALWEKTDRVPLIADRFMRGFYLEATTGSAEIMRQIESINLADRQMHDLSLRFDGGWHGGDKAA